jgi:hypothetical protein
MKRGGWIAIFLLVSAFLLGGVWLWGKRRQPRRIDLHAMPPLKPQRPRSTSGRDEGLPQVRIYAN